MCSEPPVVLRQLSGQSSLEPCLPEEAIELIEDNLAESHMTSSMDVSPTTIVNPVDPPPPIATTPSSLQVTREDLKSSSTTNLLKKPRPDFLPLLDSSTIIDLNKPTNNPERYKNLQRSNSSRTYDRPKSHRGSQNDDSIFYIRSEHCTDFYDSEQVIKERRRTLLKADSETALAERKLSSLSIPERIMEQAGGATSTDIEEAKPPDVTVLQIEFEKQQDENVLSYQTMN